MVAWDINFTLPGITNFCKIQYVTCNISAFSWWAFLPFQKCAMVLRHIMNNFMETLLNVVNSTSVWEANPWSCSVPVNTRSVSLKATVWLTLPVFSLLHDTLYMYNIRYSQVSTHSGMPFGGSSLIWAILCFKYIHCFDIEGRNCHSFLL